MQADDFRKIDTYFEAHGKKEISYLAHPIFVENVADGIARLGAQNPTAAQVRQACEGYLTDAQLKVYLAVADKTDEANRRKHHKTSLAFWGSVWSSIVANVIFAILLYGIYVASVGPSSNKVIDSLTSNTQ